MLGQVTVYFNTGFNGIDIPASSAVLATASKKNYPDSYFIREDVDKPSIRIKDSYDELCDVDYCEIITNVNGRQRKCYYFASPSALSEGVTLLSLDLDALLTMGGASNLEYISGWQERGHISKADDTLFGNVASEDWLPTEPLVAKNATALKTTTTVQNDYDVIVSNTDIGTIGGDPAYQENQQEVIEGYVSGESDPAMFWPLIKVPQSSSNFVMYDFDEGDTVAFTIPSTAAFDASNSDVKKGLQKLFSAGQLQLQASYRIPKEYLQNTPSSVGAHGQISNITGVHASKNISEIPFEYTENGYTPKNKKVFATFRDITLVNIGSGDTCTKSPEELYDGNNSYPSVKIWADPTSTGKPYARFGYIKGSPLQWFDCVKGLQWANSQLVMEGASGSMWNSLNTAFSNQQLQRAQSMNLFNNSVAMEQGAISARKMAIGAYGQVADMSADIIGLHPAISGGATLRGPQNSQSIDYSGIQTGAIGGIKKGISGIQSGMQLQQDLQMLDSNMRAAQARTNMENQNIQNEINQNSLGLIRSNNVVAPTVSFTPEQNLGLYGYNYFVAYEIRKSYNDLVSEDKYYQRYGYNGLHRPLTAQCFNERQYYCYVQAFDVNLKSTDSFGLRVRTKAISQLNKGVRVWKVLPDASYYELN